MSPAAAGYDLSFVKIQSDFFRDSPIPSMYGIFPYI